MSAPARRFLRRLPDASAERSKATFIPGSTIFLHPRVGRLEFEVQYLHLESGPGLNVHLYLPLGGAAARERMERLLRMHRRDVRNRKGRERRAAVRKAKDQIDRDYSREIPLEELAALAVGFADQSHLIRHFRRLEGMTPAEFVRRYPG